MHTSKKLLIFLITCFIFFLVSRASFAITFYVSNNGDDNNPGTLEAPFKTLEKARNVIRGINSSMTEDIIVYLRGGTYVLSNTFTLDSSDSGTNGYYIIYKNYPGEKPTLSGGQRITGWIQEGNKWKASVGSLQTRQLYVNGHRATRARSVSGLSGAVKTATGYTTTNTNMQYWGNVSDIEFVSKKQWLLYRCGVQSISGRNITMKQPCWSDSQEYAESSHANLTMGIPDWIENAYELLNRPGEWYLNRATGWLYYMPKPNEDMKNALIIAPVLETLIKGTGDLGTPIKNIRFEGLTFSYATWLAPNSNSGWPDYFCSYPHKRDTWANINFSYADSIVFEKNVFTHLGGLGIQLGKGSQNNIISGNHFFDISGNAIETYMFLAKTTDAREYSQNNQVVNNYIHNIAREYQSGVGIHMFWPRGATIANNELENLPYSGISIQAGNGETDSSVSQNNKIQDNVVSNHMKTLNDGGGIYTTGAQPGSIISGNIIKGQVNQYGALYLDNQSRYFMVFNNVIVGNAISATWIKGGDHYFYDNYWQNDLMFQPDTPCIPTACGPSRVENNTIITSEAEAPSAILSRAGLEAAYKFLKTAPIISSVSANSIDVNSATLVWSTNEIADSQVEYGLTASYGKQTPIDDHVETSHSQTLSGLAANTLYHYRVISRDVSGNITTSGDHTFKTTPVVNAPSSAPMGVE